MSEFIEVTGTIQDFKVKKLGQVEYLWLTVDVDGRTEHFAVSGRYRKNNLRYLTVILRHREWDLLWSIDFRRDL
jgi:starvation-inducible outer membrane lipoprotein